jgi:hypothetical protein
MTAYPPEIPFVIIDSMTSSKNDQRSSRSFDAFSRSPEWYNFLYCGKRLKTYVSVSTQAVGIPLLSSVKLRRLAIVLFPECCGPMSSTSQGSL